MVQRLNVALISKTKDRLMVQCLKRHLFSQNISCKKDKKQLNQRLVLKELRRSDFLITIEEYVGARETPLSTTKR